MKTCLLNLPYLQRIVRRYNCTYYAQNFLFPPLELMYLAAIVKHWKKNNCVLIDAIAEDLNLDKVIKRLKIYQPDLLVFMAGIESFIEDMKTIMIIKSNFPWFKIACIGYLPSIFPKETLESNPAIDYIIMDEPEFSFSELYDHLREKRRLNDLRGLAYKNNGAIFVGQKRERIKDLDNIPFPERSLIQQGLYNEFLLKRPFTTIQTSRGCPFECTFCIRTYGREVAQRSIQNVLAEIEEVILRYKIKTIRFIDDTFTLDKKRTIELCHNILRKDLSFEWSCLSRPDTLDGKMLSLMRRAGCKRIYLGIETTSQRVLNIYKKGYSADFLTEWVKQIKNAHIETVGFFITGGLQTENEIKNDIKSAKDLSLDYVIVEKITPYPGTKLFEEMRKSDVFNLKSYLNASKKNRLQIQEKRFEKLFYRKFYFNFYYFLKIVKYLLINPLDLINAAKKLIQFLFIAKNNQKKRTDFI